MAKSRFVWKGLSEHKQVLLQMPATMTVEAGNLSKSAANSAAVDIRGAYPSRTGRLRDGVGVSVINRGTYRTGHIVKNTNPLAHIFELGTQARHTSIGAHRGSMPPGRVFIPRMIKWRRWFIEQLKAAVLRHGASRVTG